MGMPEIFSRGRNLLERSAGGCAGGPRPLEIEATKMARYIDDFADEVEAGDFAGLHRLGVEFVGVDASGCHFGLLVTFRTCGMYGPGVEMLLKLGERLIRK